MCTCRKGQPIELQPQPACFDTSGLVCMPVHVVFTFFPLFLPTSFQQDLQDPSQGSDDSLLGIVGPVSGKRGLLLGSSASTSRKGVTTSPLRPSRPRSRANRTTDRAPPRSDLSSPCPCDQRRGATRKLTLRLQLHRAGNAGPPFCLLLPFCSWIQIKRGHGLHLFTKPGCAGPWPCRAMARSLRPMLSAARYDTVQSGPARPRAASALSLSSLSSYLFHAGRPHFGPCFGPCLWYH